MNHSMALPVSAYSATELALWSWLVFGAVVIALIPQARGMQAMIGWLLILARRRAVGGFGLCPSRAIVFDSACVL